MSVLSVVNSPPCGSERPFSAFRPAGALALRDEHIEVSCRSTCGATRGLSEDRLIQHARSATMFDLAEATVRSDRVVWF